MKHSARVVTSVSRTKLDIVGANASSTNVLSMDANRNALQLRTVSKKFGHVDALSDVTFTLKRGEFLTMLGPSGSGKSTTLRIIAGYLRPDQGDVCIEGRSIVNTPPQKRNIGMVFQDYALFPHMSVAANVAFPLKCRRVSTAESKSRVGRMLEIVGLDGKSDRLPAQLSGGQQQRVALARALVFEPQLLLLDEPMGALDKKLRQSMQFEIMRIVRALGATVVSVTHDQEEALVMSDRIAIFNNGRIEQIGSPIELYERPSSRFVADFVGESNLLPATVLDSPDLARLEDCPGITGQVSVLSDKGYETGKQITLLIRPDRIRVLHTEVAHRSALSDFENEMAGVVRERAYLGTEFRMTVEVHGGLMLKVSEKTIRNRSVFNVGSTVHLRWSAQDAVVIVSK
jgi:putative spermidine/putrescine transport system ATP-binding protein